MPGEIIAIKTGVDWALKLFGMLNRSRSRREKALDAINDILYEDPLDFVRYYVEPECQDRNPADQLDEDDMLNKAPIMEVVEKFFKKEKNKNQPGDNQMFVLSDAGMGKTSLLSMLKLMHLNRFMPSIRQCELKKLDDKTVEEIGKIEDKRHTILLLDSLDEDAAAFGRVKDRLYEILKASQPFFKVIVTCRTQFFPNVEEERLEKFGKITIQGFRCPVKYLSFFSDEKVEQYLAKRFPRRFWQSANPKAERAARLIRKMGYLRFRPMLLAYIDDLMGPREGEDGRNALEVENLDEYEIYDLLVENWLLREERKDPTLSRKALLPACIVLATYMQVEHTRKVPEEKLDRLIEKIADARPVKDIHIKGRSLLNRNSYGDYRFSHKTIQEFLVARQLLEDKPVWDPHRPIPVTDFMMDLIALGKRVANFAERLDFSGVDFTNKNLRGLKLPGSDFSGRDFSGADLSGGDFSGCDFSGCDFSGCDFSECKLAGTRFAECRLKGARFSESDISDCIFEKVDWESIDFENALLCGKKRSECLQVEELGMEFVCILPGSFAMGSPKSEKHHEVVLSRGFFMQKTPVTVGQWREFVKQSGHSPESGKWEHPGFEQTDEHPVTCVSWHDAMELARWLSKKGKGDFDLPTEAQWEYACRAGSKAAYCFGDDPQQLNEYAWFSENSGRGTHPVGTRKPNAWGLHDMHGNVWEWCSDWYGEYPDGPSVDPKGPDKGSGRVVRGGSWYEHADLCRAAFRLDFVPSDRFDSLGFRLVFLPGRQAS